MANEFCWSSTSKDFFQIYNRNRSARLNQEYCGLWCNIGSSSTFQYGVHFFAVRVDQMADSEMQVQNSELSSGWTVGVASQDFPITTGLRSHQYVVSVSPDASCSQTSMTAVRICALILYALELTSMIGDIKAFGVLPYKQDAFTPSARAGSSSAPTT